MSWPQWPVGGASTLPTVINPAPTVANPTQTVLNATVPSMVPTQYTPEQWAQMQQQNWQQWAQWQQQYQQWHQQYGAEYQKSLNALNAQGAAAQMSVPQQQPVTPYPNTSLPPPPPAEPKPPPPPPPEDPPTPTKSFENVPQNIQRGNYNQPPPSSKFGGRNSNWQPMTNNRNQRYGNQGPSPENSFGKRSSNYPGGSDSKRNKTDDNWQKMDQWNSASQKPSPKPVNPEELSEAEKKFDKQFAEWEAQFSKWKDQNANHPDKAQYREYEKKWETWRAQLLERREQMRRKRLNLASASPKTQQIEGKQPLLTTPPIEAQILNFNRPPPTVNNDPLEFSKKSASAFDDSEVNSELMLKKEFDTSFLKSASGGSIPGLDLVKEGDEDVDKSENTQAVDVDAEDARPPLLHSKPQDLEALSKGINSILGDQKLLSMLSLVSQNQNLNFTASVLNTPSTVSQPPLDKNEYSSQSMEDNSNPTGDYRFTRPPDTFNTFDDQTRSSFTTGPSDQDMRFEQSRPDDLRNRVNFRGPTDFNSFRGPGNVGDSNYDSFRGSDGTRGFNDFGGPSGFNQFRNSDNFSGFRDHIDHSGPDNMGGSRGPDNRGRARGLDNMRGLRVSDNLGGPRGSDNTGEPRGLDNMGGPRGSDNVRGTGGPDNIREPRAPDNMGGSREPDSVGRSRRPENMGAPPGFGIFGNVGENFNKSYENESNYNRGPNFERFGNDITRPDRWTNDGGPQSFNRNDNFGKTFNNQGQFDRENVKGNGPDGYTDNFANRGPGGYNIAPRDDFKGPSYIEHNYRTNRGSANTNFQHGGESNNDFRRRPPNNFNQIPEKEHETFSRRDSFNRNENSFNRRGPQNFGAESKENWKEPVRNFSDYSRTPDNFIKTDFARGSPVENCSFNFEPPEKLDRFKQPETYEQAGITSNDENAGSETTMAQILKPETVIEYDHKSLKPPEPDVIIEPIQTYDYRHKPVNRIPLPQRPKWLSETLRGVREFEPLRPIEQTRRYNDWMYDERKKYDSYYDERRRYEEPIGRHSESRYNYEDRRSYEERRSYERSRSREHDDFNEDSHHAYRNYSRHEDRRKYEDEEPVERTSRYEDRSHPPRNERDKRVADKVVEEEQVQKTSSAPVNMITNSRVTLIEDLLSPPGRFSRPPRIVIILRGPPGSGKTTLAKLIKDKEVENGGSAPRILSLDDYFMVEQEREITEDGRKVKIKDMKYEYEECMEASYRTSLMKSFKKTITDGYFNFIIVDNVNDKVKYFGEMWSFAKQNGFQVYICQLELDVQTCTKRNVHERTEAEIEKCVSGWEPTPSHHPIVDATSLIQSQSIPEVEMEEINSPPSMEEEGDEEHAYRSKWDTFDCSLDNLAKLDGISKPLKPSSTMEDYLQLDDWEPKANTKPGQKRVRWADLEERKEQEKMRAIGFVVGQTNWDRMLDPTMGGSALTQTKYIERVGKY